MMKVYRRYLEIVSTQSMSSFRPQSQEVSKYSSNAAAMPETIAEKINTMGIIGVDHQGFALTEPKMNPTYPCSRNADGIPMSVMTQPTRSSMRSARSLMLSEPSVSTLR